MAYVISTTRRCAAIIAGLTRAILSEALTLSQPLSAAVLAVSVWEGNARPTGDATQDFIDCAKRAGMRVLTVSTV